MTVILMPKLSDSMEEGTVLTWLKDNGAHVEPGDELLEIETDKSTVTHAAEVSGILEVLVDEGTSVAVGHPIARIGERAQGDAKADEPSPEAEHVPSVDGSARALASSCVALTDATSAPTTTNASLRSAATPLARRIADAHDISLANIAGTGPLGRITRQDVLRAAGVELAADAPPPPRPTPQLEPSSVPDARAPTPSGVTRQELTRLQLVIARRMAEAKATIPHFQVQTEVVMDGAIALRAQLKALASDADPVPSFNDFIVKASAIALREYPLANASYRDGAFELHAATNVGVAVATDDALVVPTVFDAASKSLAQIAQETRILAARVRDGSISPQHLEGGTFTVSNLGMFGMTAITPVINPPQAAILGVGAMRERLVRRDGETVEQTVMTLTLSCDHRILYGADAARFLALIRDLLEAPLKIAL